jgi:hypothetical protein
MPSNAGTIGGDYAIQFYDGVTGLLQDLGDVQNFKMTPLKTDLKNMPFNNDPVYDYMPDGHKITFTITRTDSRWDDFHSTREANVRNGKRNVSGVLNKSVVNADNSTSRYQYQGFVFWVLDLGDVSREKLTQVQCEGMASKMIKIA